MTDAALASESPAALHVLVVDDDDADRIIVRRSLRSAGVTTRCTDAASAGDALCAMNGERFDCVFLDYHLPGTHGLRLLREMKQLAPHTPVVVLTGQGDEQVAVELMKAGASDYLNKGLLTPERLAQSLRYAVDLSRAAAETRRAQDELQTAADRMRFLADAGRVLGGSLEVSATLQAVAEFSVPLLGDFCLIYLAEGDSIRLVACAHADPLELPLARRFAEQHVLDSDNASSAVVAALRTCATQQIMEVSDAHLAAVTRSEEDLALVRALAPTSAVIVPMIARATVFGAMLFARSAAMPHGSTDISLAEDLVQRASIAIDNARLFSLATEARDAAQAAAQRTARLQEFTAALAAAETAEQVGELVGQQGVPVAGAVAGHDLARVSVATVEEPGEWSLEDAAFVAAVRQQCAQALERVALRDAERQARSEAEEANRAKSEFLARMSHDLRTPLNAIGGYAQLIELGVHGPVSPAQTIAIGRIRRAQEHLLTLINDILSYAKLEAGHVDVVLEPVPVDSVIEELGSLVRAEATTRGLALSLDVTGDALCVHADRARLIQILLNLASNALKFTDAGTVQVSARQVGGMVAFHVQDSGRGIPPHRIESIFDPFVQLRGVADEQKGGVGLGLAISRELARRMGGEVRVESTVGVGSEFTLSLPLAEAPSVTMVSLS